MEEEKKNSNKKVVWWVLFALVAVILCYMFVVLYFYYISPYNISIKTRVWPFLSDNSMGEMYLDATVEVCAKDVWDKDTFERVDISVVGVNVRQDGYVLAPYSQFAACDEETQFQISTNSGKVFNGKLLYSDPNFDVSIFKCESIVSDEKVKLPYVSVANTISKGKVLGISSPKDNKNIWSGKLEDDGEYAVPVMIEVGGFDAVKCVYENCYSVQFGNSFEGGAVFNKHGSFLGFSYGQFKDGEYALMPATSANMFFSAVVSGYENEQAYENKLVEKFVGFDAFELYCHMDVSASSGMDKFYFQEEWREYSEAINSFYILQNYSNGGTKYYFLLEDFEYGDAVIARENAVTKIKLGDKTYDIEDKVDLLKVLYMAKSGEEITIYYLSMESEQQQSVVFNV